MTVLFHDGWPRLNFNEQTNDIQSARPNTSDEVLGVIILIQPRT